MVVETYTSASSANLSVSGNTLTINPTADLSEGTGYLVDFGAGAIRDLAGNPMAADSRYNFSTDPGVSLVSISQPEISILEGRSGQLIAPITLSLNHASNGVVIVHYTVRSGTANVGTPYDADVVGSKSGNLTIDVGSTSATLTSVAILGDLVEEPNEYFWVDFDSIIFSQFGRFTGGASVITAKVVILDDDGIAPTVLAFSPADDANGVSISSNIVLTFSEAISRGVGDIVLKTVAGATVATYNAATSSNLSVSGSVLTINPTADLGYSTAYVVEFAAGTIKDQVGIGYAGTSGYNFATAAPFVNSPPTGSFVIQGAATQGQTLTVANTLVDIDGLGLITYQWKADGANLSSGTGSSFLLTEALVGKVISVAASYTDGHGTVESVTSSGSAAVANLNDPPIGKVTVAGSATQGQILTAANTLADADGLGAIAYQWKADGVNVASAISSTFMLTEAQVGKAITVAASYTDGHGTAEAVSSTATIPVVNVNDPGSVFINGTMAAGQTLTAIATDADGLPGPTPSGSVSYQWFADGVVIGGATSGSFLVSAAQVGHTITVTAKYTDLHGTAEVVSGGLGKVVDLLAYSWNAHTLLDAVDLGGANHTTSTNAAGAASLTAGAGVTLDLTAVRGISSAEVATTNQAVNLQDAIAILKMIVGLDVNGAGKALSSYQAYAADFDGNGKVELSDAIAVLKHVVGLPSPDPQWLLFNEADITVPGKATLAPGAVPAISASLAGSASIHVGLVGVLRGDVVGDGSFGAPSAQDLDVTQPGYFQQLAIDTGLNLTQFGIYPGS